MQTCRTCNTEKPFTDFYRHTSNKSGYRYECKPCMNEISRGRDRRKKCDSCGKMCWNKGDGKYGIRCGKCKQSDTYEHYLTLTIGDKTYNKHKHAKYAYIRYWARKIAIDLGWNCCHICGYDKHFEIAHIEPISSFPPETLLSVINDPDNLVPLCPNCHWEFDFGHNRDKKQEIIKNTVKRNERLKPEARKAIRPPYDQLLAEIKELGYCGVGRKYGVTDNSIRKWQKMYEKYSGSIG